MNDKDLYLLGFISKATKYLKEEIANQEKAIADLNSENLQSFGDIDSIQEAINKGAADFERTLNNGNNDILKEFEALFDGQKEPLLKEIENEVGEVETRVPTIKEVDTEELDSILGEIVSQENEVQVKEELPSQKTYVRDLIEKLHESGITKDHKIQSKISIFEKISKIYPYLSGGFIRAVFSLKENIANETPLNIQIILLHRVYFRDLDSLRHFVELACNHNYTVNVDENKMLVDVFKEFKNTDGRIITNIFEIANQVNALDGEYEGYRVIEKNKK